SRGSAPSGWSRSQAPDAKARSPDPAASRPSRARPLHTPLLRLLRVRRTGADSWKPPPGERITRRKPRLRPDAYSTTWVISSGSVLGSWPPLLGGSLVTFGSEGFQNPGSAHAAAR